MKRYLNLNGISWVLDGDTDRAMSVRPLAQKMMHVMKMQNVNNLDHVWYTHRMEDGTVISVESLFGRDKAYVYCEPPPQIKKGRVEKKRIEYIVPAIEAYDENGNFVGLIICMSGTFEPPYVFNRIESYDILYPFKYGQWRYWYSSKPFAEEEMIRKDIIWEESKSDNKKSSFVVTDIPSTGDMLGYLEEYDKLNINTKSFDGNYEKFPDTLDCCIQLYGGTWYTATSYCFRDSISIEYDRSSKYRMSITDENKDPTSEYIIISNTFADYNRRTDFSNVYKMFLMEVSTGRDDYCDEHEANWLLNTNIDMGKIWVNDDYSSFDPGLPGAPGSQIGIIGQYIAHDQYSQPIPDDYWWRLYCSAIETVNKGAVFGGFLLYDYAYNVNVTEAITGMTACERFLATEDEMYPETVTVTDASRWIEGVAVDDVLYEYVRETLDLNSQSSYVDYEDYIKIPFPRYWNIPEGVYAGVSGLRKNSKDTTYFFVNHNAGELTVTDFASSGTFPASTATTQGNTTKHIIPGFDDMYGNGCFRLLKIVEEKEVIE